VCEDAQLDLRVIGRNEDVPIRRDEALAYLGTCSVRIDVRRFDRWMKVDLSRQWSD
jgi:hypothetical protein